MLAIFKEYYRIKTFFRRFAVFMLLCCMLAVTSCQTTPSAPIVQSKNDGKLEDSINVQEQNSVEYDFPLLTD